jgi:hypothetical protein
MVWVTANWPQKHREWHGKANLNLSPRLEKMPANQHFVADGWRRRRADGEQTGNKKPRRRAREFNVGGSYLVDFVRQLMCCETRLWSRRSWVPDPSLTPHEGPGQALGSNPGRPVPLGNPATRGARRCACGSADLAWREPSGISDINRQLTCDRHQPRKVARTIWDVSDRPASRTHPSKSTPASAHT